MLIHVVSWMLMMLTNVVIALSNIFVVLWMVEVMMSGSCMSRSFLVTMTMCILVVVLMIGLLAYHTRVMVELIFKQLWVLNQVISEHVVVCRRVEGVDHLLLKEK